MALWIRTQSRKKLLIVNEARLDNKKISCNSNHKSEIIMLGLYSSDAAALSVLDQIQAAIEQGAADGRDIIFEMPEKA